MDNQDQQSQYSAPEPSSPPSAPSGSPLNTNTPPHPPATKTNGMAIASIILAFLFPIAGLVLAIIALGQIKRKNEGGKGLAIAGLVLSVIQMIFTTLILIGLVFSTFGGVQQKAKDTERRTDINALHSQIEAFYAQSGRYPSLMEMNDTAFRSASLRGLDLEAFQDPEGNSDKLANKPTEKQYSYEVEPASCDKLGGMCTDYVLTAKLFESPTYTKSAFAAGSGLEKLCEGGVCESTQLNSDPRPTR